MKFSRIIAVILLCGAVFYADLSAEAGWKSFKKKIEKVAGKKDKKKKKDQNTVKNDGIYAENYGSGVRKSGGKCAWIELKSVQDSDNFQFKCINGSCKTVAVHGRTSRGLWRTLYYGKLEKVGAGAVLSGKRKNYTHLVFSVNGAHESYDRVAAKMEIIKRTGKTENKAKAENADNRNKINFSEIKLNKGVNLYIGNSQDGKEYAYMKFSVTKPQLANYRVNVLDPARKGSVYDQIFSDPACTKEITGKGGWDNHPQGGSLHFRHYQLRAGTYYLRLNNSSKRNNGKVKVNVTVIEYNPSWINERG